MILHLHLTREITQPKQNFMLEYKVVTVKPLKSVLTGKLVSEEEIATEMAHHADLGWRLVSSSPVNFNGATQSILLFFSREHDSME